MKERFSDAQVGDKVYCRLYGFGKVIKDYRDECNKIVCRFNDGACSYFLTGKRISSNHEPTLFYVDGDNKYAIERPIQTIKCSMLPEDTKVFVSDEECIPDHRWSNRHFKSGDKISTFRDGYSSFTAVEDYKASCVSWFYAKLAEDLIIDGITYPVGTKLVEG